MYQYLQKTALVRPACLPAILQSFGVDIVYLYYSTVYHIYVSDLLASLLYCNLLELIKYISL